MAEEIVEFEFHEMANRYPLLAGEAFEELCEDVKEHGIRQKIIMHPDGTLLDGRNRYRAWRKAGLKALDIPRIIWSGATDNKTLRALIRSLNDMRRHLTVDQRVGLAGQLLEDEMKDAEQRMLAGKQAEDPGKATDKVAERLKVTGKAVEEMKRLSSSYPAIWTDLVDKKITVQRARKMLAPPEPARKTPKEGQDLIEAAKEATKDIADAETAARRMRIAVKKWIQEPWGIHVIGKAQRLDVELGNIVTDLKNSRPYGLCGQCHGDGCDLCKKSGWLPKNMWDNLPKELKL